jgi:lysophospholipase L1-like esterase
MRRFGQVPTPPCTESHPGNGLTEPESRMHRALTVRARTGIAAITLLLAACGEPPPLEPLERDARILAFGDSLTHGTGAGDGEDYPAVLARMSGREVIESGVPGELSAEGRRRLPGVLDAVRPDLLILLHGGNDILRGKDPAATRRNLAAMVDTARGRGIPVVLVGVPERELFFRATADLYYTVAERERVPLEGEIMETIIDSPELRSDSVHPNAAGYRRLAEAVHELLVRAGALET